MPNLPVTVPGNLYDAMRAACGEPFADSYLSGAITSGGTLVTKTETARIRLTESLPAMKVLHGLGYRLVGPSFLGSMNAAA